MAFKDRINSLFAARRNMEETGEGESVTNILGEHRGYRPGATTSMSKVVEPVQPAAQEEAEAQPEKAEAAPEVQQPVQPQAAPAQPGPGFGEMPVGNMQPMGYSQPMSYTQPMTYSQPVAPAGFTSAMPYHRKATQSQPQPVVEEVTGKKFHFPLPLKKRNQAKQEQKVQPQQRVQQYQNSAWQPAVDPQSSMQQPVQPQYTQYQQPVQAQPQFTQYQQPAQAQPQFTQYQQSAQTQPQFTQYQQSAQTQPQFTQYQQAQPQQYSQQQPVQAPQGPAWGNGRGDRGFNYTHNQQRVEPRRRSTRSQERQQRAKEAAQDNVSYMNPNHFVDNGTAYAMVMRLAQPLSTARCYRLIEFMRNGESVLVNTELIQDPNEADRCLDLLYGAAFAMGCVFTRVAARSLYLITPRTVQVLPYASMEGMAQRDAAARWPGSDPSNPQDPLMGRDRGYQTQPYQYTGYQNTGYQAQNAGGIQYDRFY